jgi:DNA gyrase subunit A
VEELRVMGRATQGVRLIKLNEDDAISSVEKIPMIEIEGGEILPSAEGDVIPPPEGEATEPGSENLE